MTRMRGCLGLVALVITSCATPRQEAAQSAAPQAIAAGGDMFLDQGWSGADREVFTTTAQGSRVMPLNWFMALRRIDGDEAFAADRLQRFGYLPLLPFSEGNLLPVGFVRDGTDADPQLGMTCAACHTGQLQYRGQVWRIDGGRAHADFQAFLTELGTTARATLNEPGRFSAFATAVLGASPGAARVAKLRQDLSAWTTSYSAFMGASLPDPAWGPGRLDAFGMIFNRVAGLDLKFAGNLAPADAPARYPFIWDAPRQDHTQWTGAAPNGTYLRGMARNTGEVFGVFGSFDPVPIPIRHAIYRHSVRLANLQTLEEKVVGLRSPPWPRAQLGLDQALAARGATLFASECASCHAARPSDLVLNAWLTKVVDVGTDRRAYANSQGMADPQALLGTQQPPLFGDRLGNPSPKLSILANAVVGSLLQSALLQSPGIRRAIDRDFAEQRLPLINLAPDTTPAATATNVQSATKDLYKLQAQVPGAAYEARVLTGIWAVGPYLHNGSVPTLWELLKPAKDRMTRFSVGHQDFDPIDVGLETGPGPGRATFIVDPANGNGNGGHEYGTTLPEAERRAIVEYLKTL